MPLLFVVLVIVLIWVTGVPKLKGGTNANQSEEAGSMAPAFSTTNAHKEREIMDMYVKRGYSFDDAWRKSHEEIQKLGYYPCIPRMAYSVWYQGQFNSWCKTDDRTLETTKIDANKYNSYKSQMWYNGAKNYFAGSGYPGGVPDEVFFDMVYNHKWNRKREWEYEVYRPIPIGTLTTHPYLGDCEVVDYIFYGNPVNCGRYKLRVLKTGAITTDIAIGDHSLQKKNK